MSMRAQAIEGEALTYNAVKMMFKRAAKRAGIPRLHPHLLRHTYGIRAQEGGMPTITLQHYMGHSSSKVTERYAHAAQSERLKRARGYWFLCDQCHATWPQCETYTKRFSLELAV